MGPSRLRTVRTLALVVVLLLGTVKLGWVVNAHYPVPYWLFWRYAGCWLGAGVVALACWLAGSAVLSKLKLVLPGAERAVLSFALGLYLFFAAMFLAGLAHAYGPVWGIGLPLGMIALALPVAWRRIKKLLGALGRSARTGAWRLSPLALVLLLFGVGGCLLVYIPTLTPNNVAADARWYHVTLAEHYAAQGGIAPSPEGSFTAAYPQLSTLLYTWAFLIPKTTLFDRVELAAHLEDMIFLWTLVGVGALAARVIPRRRVGLAWTAIFLFPGIFLYDSSLSLAADHVLAFWAPAIFLCLLRAFERLEIDRCVLFGLVVSGAALTKYQAGCLVLVPISILSARAVFLTARPSQSGRRWRGVAGLAATGATVLVCTAPHWVKNAVYYHDPLYPLLHARLHARPWSQDASVYFDLIFDKAFWRPSGTLGARLTETAKALWTFSFEPHDWGGFHESVPVFGSLFTLTTLALPFLGKNKRLWALVACSYCGLFIWYWVSHQDRYLQALLPWMAAATAAVIVQIWRLGVLPRSALCVLVGLQVVWGSDVWFIPTHIWMHTSPVRVVADLIATGYQKKYVDRLYPYTPWPEIGRRLPRDAKVLVHGDFSPLGIGRMTVTDLTGWQGNIDYGRCRSPAEMYGALESMGVTHVTWTAGGGPHWSGIADDLVFFSFVELDTEGRFEEHGRFVASLPKSTPTAEKYGPVLVLGRVDGYRPGLYPLDALTVPTAGAHAPNEYPAPLRATEPQDTSLLAYAEFVVVDARISERVRLDGFASVMKSKKHGELWVRTRGTVLALTR